MRHHLSGELVEKIGIGIVVHLIVVQEVDYEIILKPVLTDDGHVAGDRQPRPGAQVLHHDFVG